MQFTVGSEASLLHRAGSIRINNDGERGVGGKISQDGHGCKLSIANTCHVNRRTKRTLGLRQIIQCDDDIVIHRATLVEPTRVLSYESNMRDRYYIFLVVIAGHHSATSDGL